MTEQTKEELKQEIKEIKKELTQKEKLILKTKEGAKKFKKEMSKSLKTAILGAFGFLMALVWRDVITEYVNVISEASPVKGKLVSAGIVTIICVVGIFLISEILSEEDKKSA